MCCRPVASSRRGLGRTRSLLKGPEDAVADLMESHKIVAGNRFVYHCGMHTEVSTHAKTEMVPEAVTAEMD